MATIVAVVASIVAPYQFREGGPLTQLVMPARALGTASAASLPLSPSRGPGTTVAEANAAASHAKDSLASSVYASAASFAPAVNIALPSAPTDVAVGDFNGDGKPDLVMADYSGGVSVLLGHGDGTFSAPINTAAHGYAVGLAVGDFNRDGKLDVVVSDDSTHDIAMLLGNGDGTFQAPKYVVVNDPYGSPSGLSGVAAGDFNGDGNLDLAVADGYPPGADAAGFSVLLGNGDGTFRGGSSYVTGNTYQTPTGVVVGDFNGDHKLDVAVTDQGGTCGVGNPDVIVAFGNGDGTFQGLRWLGDHNVFGVTAGDLTHDGKLDLITTNEKSCYLSDDSSTVEVHRSNGDGSFQPPVAYPTGERAGSDYGRANPVTTADFNGDGRLDVAAVTTGATSSGGVSVLLGNGDGALGPAENLATGSRSFAVAAADLNGDRKPDLVVANFSSSNVTILINQTPFPPLGGPPSIWELLGSPSEPCFWCMVKAILTALPVNEETGNFTHTFNDFSISGRGTPLTFVHTYNSQTASRDGPLGYGWAFNSGMSLSRDSQTGAVTIDEEGGSRITFTLSNGAYTAPPRVIATLTKNAGGTFTFVRDAREAFTFSATGQLTKEQDLNGYATTFAYNSRGQLSTITDAAGRRLTLSYTGSHLTSVTDPTGRTVRFAFDAQGNLASFTDVIAGVTKFTYDAKHLLLTMTDPRGTVVSNAYDTSGRVISQRVDPAGLNRTTTFAYTGDPLSAAGGSTTITDPKGNVTVEQFQYGERISVTKGYGTASAATWQFGYDPATMGVTSITDPNGHTTFKTYDSSGNVLSVTDALNRATTYTYDALNKVTSVTDPKGVTTTMTYDARGNLLTRSTPLPETGQTQVTTYHYGDPSHPGDVTSVTDPDGYTSSYTYDKYGDRTSVTDPLRDKTTYGYNAIGWLTSQTSPIGNTPPHNPTAYTTTFAHNPFGQVTITTDPLGHKTVQTYDKDGNLWTVTDAKGNVTTYTYDAANEQILVTRPDRTTLRTGYDADGNVITQTDGLNYTTWYLRDPLGRVSSVIDPLKRKTTSTYDGAGNLLTVTDPQKQTTTYGYDAANERTSITYSDGKTPNVTNIQYDKDGQRTSMTDGTGTSTWAYDSLNRLISSVDGAGNTVGYGYDLKGQLTSISYPGGSCTSHPTSLCITRGYDRAGRLTQITDWLRHTTTFGYDPDSNLTTEAFPQGTGIVDRFIYDSADRLMSITDTKAGRPFATFAYGRDEDNLLSSQSSTGVPPPLHENYGYTSLNQVCYSAPKAGSCTTPPSGATPYAYDAADNLIRMGTSTLAYDAANELCWKVPGSSATSTGKCGTITDPTGATTYSYDARGNRTGVTSGGKTTNLQYDEANHLISYAKGTTSASYVYNGDGLRMSKTVNGTAQPFVWDVANGLPLRLKDAATSYVYDPSGLPLEQISSTGTVLYYHHDQLGSTRLLTDASGTINPPAAAYTYDAYGNLIASTKQRNVTNPFGFAGQYTDAESGLQYLHARYYDPSTAQFLSTDPLIAVTRQPYGYVAGNPLSRTDPSGKWGPWDAAVGAVLGGVTAAVSDTGSGQGVNWQDVAGGAIGGAVGGFVCPPVSLACQGAVSGFIGSAASDLTNGRNVNWGEATANGVVGGALGAVFDQTRINILREGGADILQSSGIFSGLVSGIAGSTLIHPLFNGGLAAWDGSYSGCEIA